MLVTSYKLAPAGEQNAQRIALQAFYRSMNSGDQFKVVLVPKVRTPEFQTEPIPIPEIDEKTIGVGGALLFIYWLITLPLAPVN